MSGARAPDAALDGARFDPVSSELFSREPEKLKVLAHPLRLKILKRAQISEVSAKEAALELSEPIGKVSYHVRVLADAGLLELTRQTPRRGAIESHYRATVSLHLDDDAWQQVGFEGRRLMLAASTQEWCADVMRAVHDGGFELDGALVANAHFCADAQGLEELREALDAYYERLLAIEAGIATRVAAGEAATTEVNVGMTLYEGQASASSHAPFFARQGGRAFPMIPEDLPVSGLPGAASPGADGLGAPTV